jgi:hypothetical protein
MTDKMEPVAWMYRIRVYRESEGVWGSWSEWREGKVPNHTPTKLSEYEEATLYTADQVKELTDRATTAEAALAEARKVIEPFAEAADATIEDEEHGGAVAWEHPCAAAVDLYDFRAASRWLKANKGDA